MDTLNSHDGALRHLSYWWDLIQYSIYVPNAPKSSICGDGALRHLSYWWDLIQYSIYAPNAPYGNCLTHRNPQFVGMVRYGTYHIGGI
ncbi:hypothetical protein AmaxDRAFT_3070 [Limnospira maxima CS-328]|uniref:Uncharacterized protein n=1 Tax=Limnospira maxima CS-328 TaxID=513049 RepID=B5W2S2_LIMMA|nr:hypothetical protein AmaxDRAFT_3070 [Limnospira maxima CS-328]